MSACVEVMAEDSMEEEDAETKALLKGQLPIFESYDHLEIGKFIVFDSPPVNSRTPVTPMPQTAKIEMDLKDNAAEES